MKLALKRVAAVFAGVVTVVGLSTLADAVLRAAGIYPPSGQPMADGLFLIAAAYRTAFGFAGGLLAARLAPDHPVTHAVVLGLIGALVGTAGTIATWNRGPEFGPHWYAIAVAALAVPSAWLGGRLSGQLVGQSSIALSRPGPGAAR
jgi:hypothetical protein